MRLRRIGKIDVHARVSGNDTISTGFVFYSYAKNSNALEFHFKDQQGRPVDLLGTKVRLLLIVKDNGEDKEFKTLDEEIVTESSLNGIVRYIIPDRLMGYQGIVDGWIYLDFPDGSKTDEVHFKFTIERSKIDNAFSDAGDFYIKDFEEIKNQVSESASEALEMIDSAKTEIEDKLNNLEELRGPKGDTGPMGPQGTPAVTAEVSGFFSLYINDTGDLIVTYADEILEPALSINEEGELIYTI